MLKCQPIDLFWQDLVDWLVFFGHDRNQVVCGSMPKETILRLSQILTGNGLQIGGFVGVAHCCLARMLSYKGTICTVDPNLTHRYIKNPLLVLFQLVQHFNLSSNSMLVCGHANEQMRIFAAMGMKFDFIILDGNHDYSFVANEIKLADPILKSGGYLVLDDIDYWDGPKKAIDETLPGYVRIELDSRAGLLQKK